jgi:alpha-beta hydrolase superfamily lysophospholipase
MVDFGAELAEYAYRDYLETIAKERASKNSPGIAPGTKLFLIGSSLGGNISLQVALRKKELVAGAILLAPMLKIRVINPLTRLFIMKTAEIFPMAETIPVVNNNSYRCSKIREECDNDKLKPYQAGDMLRLGTVRSLVEMVDILESKFEQVSLPCLIMVGDEDRTVDNRGAVALAEKASSEDITLKQYPALHGLMGEPSPLLETMQEDMLNWLDTRCDREMRSHSSL